MLCSVDTHFQEWQLQAHQARPGLLFPECQHSLKPRVWHGSGDAWGPLGEPPWLPEWTGAEQCCWAVKGSLAGREQVVCLSLLITSYHLRAVVCWPQFSHCKGVFFGNVSDNHSTEAAVPMEKCITQAHWQLFYAAHYSYTLYIQELWMQCNYGRPVQQVPTAKPLSCVMCQQPRATLRP